MAVREARFPLVTGHKYSGRGVPGLSWELGFDPIGLDGALKSAFLRSNQGMPTLWVWTTLISVALDSGCPIEVGHQPSK